MKVIIPVAGIGFKLRPHTNTQPKSLFPLAGKTILSIIIEQCKDLGLKDFIFVIGHLGEKIEDYVKEKHKDIKATFVQQNERLGLAHAVYLTKDYVKNEPILIFLGDTICDSNLKKIFTIKSSVLCIKRVDNPHDFGVAVLNNTENTITKVIEKPKVPISNYALIGIYKIMETPLFFSCLGNLIATETNGHKDCYSITPALECMIESGTHFMPWKVENWYDCGNKETLLTTNATLLKKKSIIPKEVRRMNNVVIIEPVSISTQCQLENVIVGPNVSIGEKTNLKNVIVSNSIIGAYTKIENIILQDSLIGSDTCVFSRSKALNIGDDTEINL